MPVVDWAALGKGLVNSNFGRNVQMGLTNAVNRAGEVVYDAGTAINHAVDYFNPPRDPWADKGFPVYMTKANKDTHSRDTARGELGQFDPRTLPKSLPDINAYRADPTGRYGGKDGLETMPTPFKAAGAGALEYWNGGGDVPELYAYARGLARARQFGVPQLSAAQLAALALKEGRSDYGQLSYDTNNKDTVALEKRLEASGLAYGPASFAANVAEKSARAQRLGVPFAQTWNGMGTTNTGSTGAGYARNFEHFLKAAQHPKNKPLVDFIQSALDAERPRQ